MTGAPLAVPPAAPVSRRGLPLTSLVVALIAATVGFLAAGQLRGAPPPAQPLEAESEADLTRILADLNAEADALQNEIADLKVQLNELRRSTQSDAIATRQAEEQLRTLQVLAGTVPVTGPGLVLSVTDSDGSLRAEAMIDIVQELRDAGAEALAINGRRIGVATAFAERGGEITVDGVAIGSPYIVAAIGQPATLEGGLKIPGGVIDTLHAIRGVKVRLERRARVVLPALAKAPTFDAARPVGSGP